MHRLTMLLEQLQRNPMWSLCATISANQGPSARFGLTFIPGQNVPGKIIFIYVVFTEAEDFGVNLF